MATTVAVGLLGIGGAAAASATPPRIVAKPDNAIVNTKIMLTGSGFAARVKLTIRECTSTGWVVIAENPCNVDNAISVVTDAHGRFTHRFKLEICPHSVPKTGPATRRTCYIGSPRPRGVDTIALIGAAKVIVTYP